MCASRGRPASRRRCSCSIPAATRWSSRRSKTSASCLPGSVPLGGGAPPGDNPLRTTAVHRRTAAGTVHFTGGKPMKASASVALGVALLLSGAASAPAKYSLSIATGGTGGVYYPLGGGMANVLSKYVPGMQATAEVTGGSVDNLKLIATGKPYIALAMADASQDAALGVGKFKGSKVPVRTLMVLYTNIMHVVTVEGTGIKTMKDLKGKRLSTGSPGSATEVMAFRLLEAAGIDPMKDITRERLGVAES